MCLLRTGYCRSRAASRATETPMPKEQSARRNDERPQPNVTNISPSPTSQRQLRGGEVARVPAAVSHHARVHQIEDRRTDPWRKSRKVLDSRKFVTVSELAGYWRVSERTVYRHILKGALPVVRIGPFGRLRIRTRDALRYGRPDNGS